jgi:hypothetical protein
VYAQVNSILFVYAQVNSFLFVYAQVNSILYLFAVTQNLKLGIHKGEEYLQHDMPRRNRNKKGTPRNV